MWLKEPFMAISFYLGLILPVMAPVVVLRAFVFMPAAYGIWPTMYLAGVLLMSILMCTSYLLLKRSNLWLYGVPFCFFYLFVLLWQIVWALLTFWKSEWGTRKTSADVAAEEKLRYEQKMFVMASDTAKAAEAARTPQSSPAEPARHGAE